MPSSYQHGDEITGTWIRSLQNWKDLRAVREYCYSHCIYGNCTRRPCSFKHEKPPTLAPDLYRGGDQLRRQANGRS